MATDSTSGSTRRSPYIVNAWYDWGFFLLPPLASLLVGALVSGTWLSEDRFWLNGRRSTWTTLLMGIIIHAHLFAVFVRSHLNPDVFPRHRIRFVLVPIATFVSMMVSMWAVVIGTLLVTFWDVWHSALQTFGLGRIYDRNQGNDPEVGRRLDLGLNLLLYIGPIVSGATMLAHFEKFALFEEVGAMMLTQIPTEMQTHQQKIAWGFVVGGAIFVAYYIFAYVRLWRRGYRIGMQKVFLLATTGFCSIWAWGFNPFGQAFVIMNLFHAVQYFGLVWWSEQRVLVGRIGLMGKRFGKVVAAMVFVAITAIYGTVAEVIADDTRWMWSLVQTVALMHFFYDGFIWSVRRRQI